MSNLRPINGTIETVLHVLEPNVDSEIEDLYESDEEEGDLLEVPLPQRIEDKVTEYKGIEEELNVLPEPDDQIDPEDQSISRNSGNSLPSLSEYSDHVF